MFSLCLFLVCQFCVCVCLKVWTRMRICWHIREPSFDLCVLSLTVCVWMRAPVLVCLCISVCMHVCGRAVSSFDCIHLPSQLLILIFLAPFRHILPSFHSSLPSSTPSLSPVGVETEAQVGAADTSLLSSSCTVTRSYLGFVFGESKKHHSLHHVSQYQEMYFIIAQSCNIGWLIEKIIKVIKKWMEGCTVKVWRLSFLCSNLDYCTFFSHHLVVWSLIRNQMGPIGKQAKQGWNMKEQALNLCLMWCGFASLNHFLL